MARLEVGDTCTLTNTFTLDDVATDPTTVTLTVTTPTGTTSSPSVSNTGVGVYEATFTAAAAGLHLFTWTGVGTVDDVQDGSFRVFASADRTLYAGLAELKDSLQISDTRDDQSLQQALNTACRAVDRFCGRTFHYGDAGEVRYFSNDNPAVLHVDDLIAVTLVEVDGGTGAFATTVTEDTHFYVSPRAAATVNAPYTSLHRLTGSWPCGHERVKVTGTFGWPSVPDEVVQATLLQASRIWKRTREAPFGIAGLNLDGGGMRLLARLDPDVELQLLPYQRPLVA